MCTYLHVWSTSLLVCVYIITYMHTEFETVDRCFHIGRLSLHVFVYISTYNGNYMCVGIYLQICTPSLQMCVRRVHVCVRIFTYMCAKSTWVCTYICIYAHVRINASIHVCVCILFTGVIYMCLWVCTYIYVCTRGPMGAYRYTVCASEYMHKYLCLCVCVYVYACIHIYMKRHRVCIRIYMCAYIRHICTSTSHVGV